MSDLLVAAEGAGASFVELRSIAAQSSAAKSSAANNEDVGRNSVEEFCPVNDLEVAAAAATSFQQETISSSEEETSSDESSSSESSSDAESSSSDDDDDDVVHVDDVINMIDDDDDDVIDAGMRRDLAQDVQKGAEEFVKLELTVGSEEDAKVRLHLMETIGKERRADVMEIDVSDEDDAENGVKGAKATNREELLKEVNDLMEKVPDGAAANNDFILPKLNKMETNITISTTDKLDLAGAISSTVEGMIVVKAKFMSRPLEIGSLLALACRTPLGRVQEIFGPVENPFYILQLLHDDLSDRIQPNAQVFSVEKHSQYIIPILLNQGQTERDVDGDDDVIDDDDDDVIETHLQQDVPPLVGGHAFLEERRKRRVKRSSGSSMPAKKFQRNSTETKNVQKNIGGGKMGQGSSQHPINHRGNPPPSHHLPPQQYGSQGRHSTQHTSGNQNGPPPPYWGPPPNQWCLPPNHSPHSRPELPFNQANHPGCSGGPLPPSIHPNPTHWGGPPPNTWSTPPAPSFNRRMAGADPCPPPPPSQTGNCGPNGGGPFQFGMQGGMPQGGHFNSGPQGNNYNGGMQFQGGWGGPGNGIPPPPQGNPGMVWQNSGGNGWGGADQQVRPNFGSGEFRGNGGRGFDQRGRGGWSGFGSSTPPGLE